MAKFEVTMHYTQADGTQGVLQDTVAGNIKIRRQCKENREWLRENGCLEVKVTVIEVGSTYRVREVDP